MLKQVSIAALVLGIAGVQGCAVESFEDQTLDVGSVEQGLVCYDNNGVNPALASLAVAMAKEIRELNPVRDLEVSNGWVRLSNTGRTKCNSNGSCQLIDGLLALQDDGINNRISNTVFNAANFRNTLVASYQRQLDWEANLARNNPGALPPAHNLVFSHAQDMGGCDTHFVFDAFLANCGGGSAGAFVESGGMVVMEAENFHSSSTNNSADSWTQVSDGSASGGKLMMVGPDNGGFWSSNINTTAPYLSYQVNFSSSGTYTMYIRGKSGPAEPWAADSVHGGLDGNSPSSAQYFDYPENGALTWISKTINVPSTGLHTVNVFAREDGFLVDKVVLQKWGGAPWGNGPNQSSQAGGCTMSNPADIENRMAFFENGGNPYLAFYSTSSEIGIDPSYVPGTSTDTSSGSCPVAAIKIDYTYSINGSICCNSSGQVGSYQPYSSTRPYVFLCIVP